MKRKSVLLDLRDIKTPSHGFGQIAKNYARHFSQLHLEDLRFVFLLPEEYDEHISEDVECVPFTSDMKHNHRLLPKVDLWHSVNQFQRLQRLDKNTHFILTIHDLNFLREKNWIRQQKHKFVLNRMIQKTSAVTAISEFVAEEIRTHLKLRSTPLHMIHDAVERIDQKPQERPGFVSDNPFFFTIGQIRMKKNFHLLLDVMKSFPNYKLYICGDDHFEAAKLIKSRIEKEKIDNVILTGKINDPERFWLYAHCEAFLFPSQGEGFGLPPIEAMQFGKAVFVAPFTSLPEVTGGHAIVWDNVQTETMVESIKKILPSFYDDHKRIETMKEYAFSFGYEQHIQKYVELYRKVLNDER